MKATLLRERLAYSMTLWRWQKGKADAYKRKKQGDKSEGREGGVENAFGRARHD